MKIFKLFIADLFLLLLTIVLGYTYIVTKWVLWEVGEYYFLSLRFLLSSAIMLLFILPKLEKFTVNIIKLASMCGIFLALAFYLQTVGLEYSSPGTAGMITGLSVVMVPFLYFFFSKKPLQVAAVMGGLIAFSGLLIFSYDEKSIENDALGELYLFFCAIAFAIHFFLIDRVFRKFPHLDSQIFAFIQVFIVGVVFVPFALLKEQFPWPVSDKIIFGFLYDVIFGTVLVYLALTIIEKYSPPNHISLIFSTEAVFAFLFSWWLYGEIITSRVLIGAILIVTGILITEILEKHKFKLRGKFKLWQYQKKQ